jgi:tetratricopeptide (TPR) repeat protein
MPLTAQGGVSTRGLLSTSSLGELLVSALEHRWHGSFVFETSEGKKGALFVDAGCVTKARTPDTVEPLGRLLTDAKVVAAATIDAALARAGQTGRRLGEVLIESGAATPEQVSAALAEQLGRRVSLLAGWPGSSAYGFYADRDFLPGWPVCEAEPLALIWRALRDAPQLTSQQQATLTALTGRKLRLYAGSAPERLGLSESEQLVINALRTRPRALEELLRAALLDGERLKRLMYALTRTHQIDQGPSLAPPVTRSQRPPQRVSAPPNRVSAPPQRSSTPPDRVSAPPARAAGRPSGAQSLRPPSSLRPAERRSDAAQSLHPTDPVVLARARANYDAAREQVQRQQFEAAAQLARKACEEDTGNAEYLALHAWLRAQLGELQNPDHAALIVAALDRAVLKERESVSIRFYRGQVLNRLGREEEALRDFRFVLRHEPGHVDAARELRLHEMRKRTGKRPSLLAKLFLR